MPTLHELKDKAVEAMTLRVLIWLIVGSGGGGVAFAWGADIWGAVGRSKENQAQITSMNVAMTAHMAAEEKQLAQIQEDLAYLKMIWGDAEVLTTGADEVYAVRNTKSPARRFQPGTEIWVTNNDDPGERRIKIRLREGGFRGDADILLRLSAKAADELGTTERIVSIGIEPVVEEAKDDD